MIAEPITSSRVRTRNAVSPAKGSVPSRGVKSGVAVDIGGTGETTRERVAKRLKAAKLGARFAKKSPAQLKVEALSRKLKPLETLYVNQLLRGSKVEMEKMSPMAYKRKMLRRLVGMSGHLVQNVAQNASSDVLRELQALVAKNKATLEAKKKRTDKPMRNEIAPNPVWAKRLFPKRKDLSARAVGLVVQSAIAHGMSIGLRKALSLSKPAPLVRASVRDLAGEALELGV